MTFTHNIQADEWERIKDLGSFMAPVEALPAEFVKKLKLDGSTHANIDLAEWDWREGEPVGDTIPVVFTL